MQKHYLTFHLMLLSLLLNWANGVLKSTNPEQLHLSLGTNETEMVITWAITLAIPDVALVEYGLKADQLHSQARAEVTHFTGGANLYTFRAIMISLVPDMIYYYRVGSAQSNWSTVYQFRTHPSGADWNPQFAIYGDLGFKNAESLPFLVEQVNRNAVDAIFHAGDFAYDLHTFYGKIGNKFMRSIEPIAARVPYMVCPGNHESHSNFSHYDARFTMIGDRHEPNHHAPLTSRLNNHFHSMDIGPAHILMFSTEFYYSTKYGWDQIERQFRALEEDLIRANANRAQRPWIIVMGHRPLYCLMLLDNCNKIALEREPLRRGVRMRDNRKARLEFGLENLFFKYGVDLHFYGHEHFFARLLPLYDYTVLSGRNSSNPYDNPEGPVMMVTGSAGNQEKHALLNPKVDIHEWIASHHHDYGFTRLTFKDRQHIVLEQISVEKNGATIDQIEIVKQSPYPKWMVNNTRECNFTTNENFPITGK